MECDLGFFDPAPVVEEGDAVADLSEEAGDTERESWE